MKVKIILYIDVEKRTEIARKWKWLKSKFKTTYQRNRCEIEVDMDAVPAKGDYIGVSPYLYPQEIKMVYLDTKSGLWMISLGTADLRVDSPSSVVGTANLKSNGWAIRREQEDGQ